MITEQAPAGQQLAFEYQLEAPPEKVWRALTVPALRDYWLRPAQASVVAEVVEADPPARLSWRWHETGRPADLVTFTLRPNGEGGTLLRLVHARQPEWTLRPAANMNVTMAMAA
ncbi:MAG: SRPBCC domain-containing protein [Devosia sp.]|nr:SRPBCC domain-containing protein [Devosia sp.]